MMLTVDPMIDLSIQQSTTLISTVCDIIVDRSTDGWQGHLEYFIFNSDGLEDGEDSPVVQSCFNMYPLTCINDNSDATPIGNNYYKRYYVDPPRRESDTNQAKLEGSASGYVVTGRYQLPEGLTLQALHRSYRSYRSYGAL